MDAVSEVLIARADKGDGLTSLVGASALAHVVLVGVFVFVPAWWFGAENKTPETIMEVSLGGPEGPDKSGLASLSARPTQAVAVETKKTIEPVRPPAAKTPEMIDPTKAPRKTTPNKVDAKDPRSTKPTVGKEIVQGTAVAQTNAKGMGFNGLSQGGGGAGAYLDVANFCCPEYLSTVYANIKTNWNDRQGAAGTTLMRFVIQKDGRIVDISIEKSSGVQALDFYAQRALMLAKAPPLPSAFADPALVVHLYFDYTR